MAKTAFACVPGDPETREESMTVQDWLAQLLARPATEPIEWETLSVTLSDPTWKGLWREIEAGEAYDDGLELGLRLLRATEQHRDRLGQGGYRARQIPVYRTILSMLEKAQRWDVYLAAWETIRTHTSHCVPGRGDTLTLHDPEYMSFVRREDGGFGIPALPYGVPPPKTIAVHFLYPEMHRKKLIERKLAQERAGRRAAGRRPLPPSALAAEEIQARLIPVREAVG